MRGATGIRPGIDVKRRFQSTLPYAGSDLAHFIFPKAFRFQSTLPYAGSDFYEILDAEEEDNFNPRSPMRGATPKYAHIFDFNTICSIFCKNPVINHRIILHKNSKYRCEHAGNF